MQSLESYCAYCRIPIPSGEGWRCRDCGIHFCHSCLEKASQENNRGPMCPCKSTNVLAVAESRVWATEELLRLKEYLKEIAFRPILLFGRFRKGRNHELVLNRYFVNELVLPQQISEWIWELDRFIITNLEESLQKLTPVFRKLTGSQDISLEDLQEFDIKLGFMKKQIELFDSAVSKRMDPLEEILAEWEESVLVLEEMGEYLKELFPLHLLNPAERVIGVTGSLGIKLGGASARRVRVVITTERIMFFEKRLHRTGIKIGRGFSHIKELLPEELLEVILEKRRFRRSSLRIKAPKRDFLIIGRKKELEKMYFYLSCAFDGSLIHKAQQNIPTLRWQCDTYQRAVLRLLSFRNLDHTNSGSFYSDDPEGRPGMSGEPYDIQVSSYGQTRLRELSLKKRAIEKVLFDLRISRDPDAISQRILLETQLEEIEDEMRRIVSETPQENSAYSR